MFFKRTPLWPKIIPSLYVGLGLVSVLIAFYFQLPFSPIFLHPKNALCKRDREDNNNGAKIPVHNVLLN